MGFKFPAMHKDTNPFLLGALAAAVLVPWVGFDSLGWKTANASSALSAKHAEEAVVAAYAGICSVQFKGGKDLPERLAVLAKTEHWSRGEILVKSGYATMPGAKAPLAGVSQSCADLLVPEKS